MAYNLFLDYYPITTSDDLFIFHPERHIACIQPDEGHKELMNVIL